MKVRKTDCTRRRIEKLERKITARVGLQRKGHGGSVARANHGTE